MKNIFYNWKTLAVFILMFGFVLAACEKDDVDGNDGTVQLLSYGPAGVSPGDTIQIIGQNLNQVTAIVLGGVEIPASSFVSHTPEKILVVVPDAATRGKLVMKTAAGEIESKALIDFNVPVVISNIPAIVRPGQTLTLNGKFLNWIESIKVPVDSTITEFTDVTLTGLTFVVPKNIRAGQWVFQTGGTDPFVITSEEDVEVVLPSFTNISPSPLRPGGEVTITGSDLDLVKSIKLNGVSTPVSTFTSQAADKIQFKAPDATKAGKVTLVAFSDVEVMSSQDLTILLPAVTSFAPATGERETNLTINGTNLDLVKGVKFNGATNPISVFESQSTTKIVVKIPKEAVSGVIGLVTVSGVVVESSTSLLIKGDLPPLDPFPTGAAVYTDALQNGWQDWSWNTRDLNSSAVVRQGTRSIYATYGGDGYQGMQFYNDGFNTAGSATLEFSVYGTPGTGGKRFNIILNNDWGNQYPTPNIVEGEWTRMVFPLNTLGSLPKITHIILQSNGFSGSVYMDHIGFR